MQAVSTHSHRCLKRFLHCFVLLQLLLFVCVEAVENSIIPTMENFESIQNLSEAKYSKEQFKKIAAALKQKRNRIRVTSYNMLFNLFDQNLAPENRWSERLPRIVALLDEMNPDVIGTQELQPD